MLFYNLILAVCFYGCLAFVYAELRNQTRHQKGLVLGVTLPAEADALPEVSQTVRTFRKQLDFVCVLLLLISVPLFFIQNIMVSMTLWIVWMLAMMFLPYLPYLKANRELKVLKKEHQWPVTPAVRIVDTAASECSLPKPIGLWTLLLPLVLSVLPAFLPGQPVVLRGVYLADALSLVLLWICGRWLFRRRADMITSDSARNQTLVRVRRLSWDRFWRFNLWACGVLNLCMYLFQNSGFYLVVLLLLTVVILAGSLWMELSLRRTQEHLTAGADILADEDDAWLGGVFYYNPSDNRTMVAQRLGIGTTVNLATKGGKLYLIAVAAVLLLCLLIGPVLGMVDSDPPRLEVTSENTLVSLHGSKEKYVIPIDDITGIELRDTLPESSRVFGVGMPHYLEGDFSVSGEGAAKFCLDPTAPVFLRVETESRTYWFTAETPEQTRQIAEWLRLHAPA